MASTAANGENTTAGGCIEPEHNFAERTAESSDRASTATRMKKVVGKGCSLMSELAAAIPHDLAPRPQAAE